MRGRCAYLTAGFVVLLASSVAALPPPPLAGGLGCCVETEDFGPEQPTVTYCIVVTEQQCRAQFGRATVGLDFAPGQFCNANRDGCTLFVPPDILTSTTLARRPEDCFTDQAKGILRIHQGEDVTVCGQICNQTGLLLSRASLNIVPFAEPEFTDISVNIPDGTCATVRKVIGWDLVDTALGSDRSIEVLNQWCAGNGSIPSGSCDFSSGAHSGEGGAAGPMVSVFTDEQGALLLFVPTQGAPALGDWLLGALALTLVGAGAWRVTRR